jgi:hypothetical protein
MPVRDESHVREVEVASERDPWRVESSEERFDRIAFARRALDLVRPVGTRVAICEGTAAVHVASGRNWRGGYARWAVLSIPPRASRRAIALAVAELAGRSPAAPFAFDVLLAGA